MRRKRPIGLVAIVVYKVFAAAVLASAAVAIFLTLAHHRALQAFAEAHFVEAGKEAIVGWLLSRLLDLTPRTLKLSGIATAAYAIVTAIEAIGLWYEKVWAELLVIALLSLSLPPEIYELLQGASLLKWVTFVANLLSLGYVLYRFLKTKRQTS
ncbi:DUF2127 domain-containing protein [Phormidium tenue FACHB-886]|nr:DUF2127 domain-containing protein [Phormidium tenue FACHB-886]